MSRLAAVFEINRTGFNLTRALQLLCVLAVPLVVLGALDQEKFVLSAVFAVLFVALSDPGGAYSTRWREMAGVGIVGTALTALGFALGGGPWGWVVLAAVAVTFISGLALRFGVHRFVAALLLNTWFLIALSVPAAEHLTFANSDWWGQSLAWLGGSALWIAFALVVWLARGETTQPSHFPEIPDDMTSTALSKPVILFMAIRACLVSTVNKNTAATVAPMSVPARRCSATRAVC